MRIICRTASSLWMVHSVHCAAADHERWTFIMPPPPHLSQMPFINTTRLFKFSFSSFFFVLALSVVHVERQHTRFKEKELNCRKVQRTKRYRRPFLWLAHKRRVCSFQEMKNLPTYPLHFPRGFPTRVLNSTRDNRPFAQLSPGLETRGIRWRSVSHLHNDFSVSDEQKAVFLVSVSDCSECDSYAGDWPTVTGCPGQ